jgi:hypothetical protein
MKTSENIAELAKAMSEAQRNIKPAVKDGLNPHFRSKYTSISSVWESMREPMMSLGLTVWQDVTTQDKLVSVETRIVHSSGQWVEFGPLTMPVSKPDAQGFGSGISYAKRYALCAAIGIVSSDEDDDASSAVDRSTGEVKPSRHQDIQVPHIPLNEKQKEEIECLLSGIDDKDWIESMKAKAKVKDFADISAERFSGLIKALSAKVSE